MVNSIRNIVMQRIAARKRPPIKEKFRMTRTQVIVVGVVAVVAALLTGYVWVSLQSWQDMSSQTKYANDSVKRQVLALESRARTPTEVDTAIDTITNKIDDLCAMSPFVSWQQRISSDARGIFKSCNTYQKTLTNVRDSLQVLSSRVASEQRFTSVIGRHQQAIAQVPADQLDAQLQGWQAFSLELKGMKVHTSLEKTKQSAVATTEELSAAYEALLEANKEENRGEFDAAVAAIEKGYSKLGEIQNLSTESFGQLVDKVRKTSQTL